MDRSSPSASIITHWKIKYFVLFCAFCLVVLLTAFVLVPGEDYWTDLSQLSDNIIVNLTLESSTPVNHALSFPKCRIRYYDPFDSQVMPFYKNITQEMNCGKSFAFAEKGMSAVFFNKTALAETIGTKEDEFVCKLYSIHTEGEGTTSDEYSIRFVKYLSTGKFNFSKEFAHIKCRHKDGREFYNDFFAFIHEKEKVEARCNKATKEEENKGKTQFNVVLLGIDSLSHRNFLRHFPKTHTFLQTHFDLLEFHGYTRLGSTTFLCVLPLLTGKLGKELNAGKGPYDDLPFIWKNFSSHGYRTMFAEDDPNAALLNYEKKGLFFQPTDYYMRPFYLAMEGEGKPVEKPLLSIKVNQFVLTARISTQNKQCVNGKLHVAFVHEWLQDFMTHFSNRPIFAYAFTTRLTHDKLNNAGYADYPMLGFFEWYRDCSARQNTFFVFYGDHGMRHGPFRETEMGADESNLPLLMIIPPTNLSHRYPEIYKNLVKNQRRLLTLFDVHETFKHILNFPGSVKEENAESFQRAISLFNEIPIERTCEDAGISSVYCPCREGKEFHVDNNDIIGLAKLLLEEINRLTQFEREKCSLLKLHKVMSVRPYSVSRRVTPTTELKEVNKIQINFVTKPGKGVFEGVVECDGKNIRHCSIVGEIQRINLYKDQSDCIHDWMLKNYCYCTNI